MTRAYGLIILISTFGALFPVQACKVRFAPSKHHSSNSSFFASTYPSITALRSNSYFQKLVASGYWPEIHPVGTMSMTSISAEFSEEFAFKRVKINASVVRKFEFSVTLEFHPWVHPDGYSKFSEAMMKEILKFLFYCINCPFLLQVFFFEDLVTSFHSSIRENIR